MKKISPYQVSFSIYKRESDCCAICRNEFDIYSRYALIYEHGNHIDAEKTCGACSNHEEAIREANQESRRYTNIAIGINNGNWNGNRCACGNVALTFKKNVGDFCIKCSIENRMMSKLQAESNLILRAIRELKKEIKIQKELIY